MYISLNLSSEQAGPIMPIYKLLIFAPTKNPWSNSNVIGIPSIWAHPFWKSRGNFSLYVELIRLLTTMDKQTVCRLHGRSLWRLDWQGEFVYRVTAWSKCSVCCMRQSLGGGSSDVTEAVTRLCYLAGGETVASQHFNYSMRLSSDGKLTRIF